MKAVGGGGEGGGGGGGGGGGKGVCVYFISTRDEPSPNGDRHALIRIPGYSLICSLNSGASYYIYV